MLLKEPAGTRMVEGNTKERHRPVSNFHTSTLLHVKQLLHKEHKCSEHVAQKIGTDQNSNLTLLASIAQNTENTKIENTEYKKQASSTNSKRKEVRCTLHSTTSLALNHLHTSLEYRTWGRHLSRNTK